MTTKIKKVAEHYVSTAKEIVRLNQEIEALIPETIREKQAEIKKLSKLLDETKAEIREEMHSGEDFMVLGYKFDAIPVTVLNPRKVLKRIGEEEFIKRATITQTALKDILTAVEIGKCEDLKANEFRLNIKEAK